MINKEEREAIIRIIKKGVVPAIGCTEPVCVALATAKATELLGQRPERVEVRLSANILKNAMGVGIPGTGMVGLPIAIALGALIGKSSYGLEVLKDCTPEAVAEGKAYDEAGHIQISLAEDAPDKLFVEVKAIAGEHSGTAAIARQHTNFILEKKGEEVLLEKQLGAVEAKVDDDDTPELTLRKIHEFATTTPIEEL